MFIGANGAGKSALLEAIGLLGAAASGKVNSSSLKERGVRPGLPWLYRSAFNDLEPPATIQLSARWGQASLEVALTNQDKEAVSSTWHFASEQLHDEAGPEVHRNGEPQFDASAGLVALKRVEFDAATDAAKLIDGLAEYRIYTPTTATLRGTEPDPRQQEPLGLSGGRLADAYHHLIDQDARMAAIRQLAKLPQEPDSSDELCEMIGWAEGVGTFDLSDAPVSPDVPSTRKVLIFHDRYMKKALSAYDASEGALFVAFAQALCNLTGTPKLAAIENLDNAINPRLARRLMSAICKWTVADDTRNAKKSGRGTEAEDAESMAALVGARFAATARPRQLLLTTHSPLMLDGLPLQDDRFRLFTVDRTNKGRTEVHRVVLDKKMKTKIDAGWTLSRLWVMGHLGGGVPDV